MPLSRLLSPALGLLALSMSAVHAHAVVFTVTDADFAGGIYDFRYLTDHNGFASRTEINGADQGVTDPTLTNGGWVCCRDDGARFWHAQGEAFGFPELTSGALTMGWDFSAVTGQIAKVELNPRHFLFQFNPWNEEAVGDQIAGFVSTPASFGSGGYNEIYRFTGTAGTQITVGAGTLDDYTSDIAGAWLDDPDLLELKFTYEQTPGSTGLNFDQGFTIPAAHLQIFRGFQDSAFFQLRVTLNDEPVAVPVPATLPLLLTGCIGLLALGRRRPG